MAEASQNMVFPAVPTLCMVHSPSFYQIQHSEAESFPRCQCHLRRVALADTHGAADLLGNDHPAQVVDPSHDSSCLHIVKPFLLLFFPWQELASDVVFPAGGWLCWKNEGRGGRRELGDGFPKNIAVFSKGSVNWDGLYAILSLDGQGRPEGAGGPAGRRNPGPRRSLGRPAGTR